MWLSVDNQWCPSIELAMKGYVAFTNKCGKNLNLDCNVVHWLTYVDNRRVDLFIWGRDKSQFHLRDRPIENGNLISYIRKDDREKFLPCPRLGQVRCA